QLTQPHLSATIPRNHTGASKRRVVILAFASASVCGPSKPPGCRSRALTSRRPPSLIRRSSGTCLTNRHPPSGMREILGGDDPEGEAGPATLRLVRRTDGGGVHDRWRRCPGQDGPDRQRPEWQLLFVSVRRPDLHSVHGGH